MEGRTVSFTHVFQGFGNAISKVTGILMPFIYV